MQIVQSVQKVALYIIMAIVIFIMLAPFFWMLSISVRGPNELFTTPPSIIPPSFSFSNYVVVWKQASFMRYLINSVVFTTVSTGFTLFLCSLGGYVFGRFRFPGGNALFMVILFTMMLPDQSLIIPRFLMVKVFPLAGGNNIFGQGGTGLINTYAGMISPFLVTGLGIFLFRQFFLTLPTDLEDAARVDGCSEFRIFWQIMLPLTKPAIIALSIFTVTWRWNKLVWPLVVASSRSMRVLSVGLAVFAGEQHAGAQWNEMMAAATIAVTPVIIFFILAQRHFTKGIALTGLKG